MNIYLFIYFFFFRCKKRKLTFFFLIPPTKALIGWLFLFLCVSKNKWIESMKPAASCKQYSSSLYISSTALYQLPTQQCHCLAPSVWGTAGFEPVDLADLGRFNTNSMAFQLFVSSVPIQCVPAEPLPVAFTWHCPGSVGKKRVKLPRYSRPLPWKPTTGGDIKAMKRRETLWAAGSST